MKQSLRHTETFDTGLSHRHHLNNHILVSGLRSCLVAHEDQYWGLFLLTHLSNIFCFLLQDCDISNFANDNTIHACDTDINNAINRLNNDVQVALNWKSN